MRRYRPASITVIAILHFVFGGLGIAGGLCTGVQLAVGNQLFNAMAGAQAAQQRQLQEAMEKDLQKIGFKPVAYAGVGADLLMSGLMIAAGVGLLRLQPWGRTLSICYALLSIAWKIFTAVYAFAFSIPAMRELLAAMPRQQGEAEQMQETLLKATEFGMVVGAIMPLVAMIYPVVVLIIMAQPSVKAALLGRATQPTYEEDYPDEPEDYRDESEDR